MISFCRNRLSLAVLPPNCDRFQDDLRGKGAIGFMIFPVCGVK